jgi:hypothetical protein
MAAGTITNEHIWSTGHRTKCFAATIELNGTTAVVLYAHLNTVHQVIFGNGAGAVLAGVPYRYSVSGGSVSIKSSSGSDTGVTVDVLCIGF